MTTAAIVNLNHPAHTARWHFFSMSLQYHFLLLPLAVVARVVAHILLVCELGIVTPFSLAGPLDSSIRSRAHPRTGVFSRACARA